MPDPRAAPRIALIGFMAAGKSVVGRCLAGRLGCDFVDLDQQIVEQAGRSIPEVFAAEGETGFRAREHEALATVAVRPRWVLACGGGVVAREANLALLRLRALTVYLAVSPEEAARRLLADGVGRPLIDDHVPARTSEHITARVRELLAVRDPLYRAAAELVVSADEDPPEQVAAAICAALIA